MSDILDGFTPTEYLVLDVMAGRYRLGDDGWTFPTALRPALNRLAIRGYLNYKSGVVQQTLLAWLTSDGAKRLKLDEPYMLHGKQRGRVWFDPADDTPSVSVRTGEQDGHTERREST